MSTRLSRIVANLLRHVPDPPPPVARPTASFASLKVGQQIAIPGSNVPWRVVRTDSLGADIITEGVPAAMHRITDRNWKASWSRVRRRR